MVEHGGRGDSPAEKAREEFFSEAQEIVDGLSRDLLELDSLAKRGLSDPELVNDVFRAVHTMKGLSGLFGAAMMSGLSHELEDLLDDLRLGRVELSPEVLDLLFQSVALYGQILASAKGEMAEPVAEVNLLLAKLGQLSGGQGRGGRARSLSTSSIPVSLASSRSTRSTGCARASRRGSGCTASAFSSRSSRSTPRSTT